MPEHLKPCCIIVYHEEILLVLVVLFVFELEFHAEDTLRRILITAVSNTAILVGNPFVVIRDEEQTISSRFDYIADRLRLDEIQYGDLVSDFPHHAHKGKTRVSSIHVASFHLEIKHRHQHFLWGGTAMHIVLPAASHFEHIVADRVRHPFGIGAAEDFSHFHAGNAISGNWFR